MNVVTRKRSPRSARAYALASCERLLEANEKLKGKPRNWAAFEALYDQAVDAALLAVGTARTERLLRKKA